MLILKSCTERYESRDTSRWFKGQTKKFFRRLFSTQLYSITSFYQISKALIQSSKNLPPPIFPNHAKFLSQSRKNNFAWPGTWHHGRPCVRISYSCLPETWTSRDDHGQWTPSCSSETWFWVVTCFSSSWFTEIIFLHFFRKKEILIAIYEEIRGPRDQKWIRD